MFKKTILLIFVVFTACVVSGCKVLDEYAKSSRKYNSNRSSYSRKTYKKKPYASPKMRKMMTDYYHSRK